MHCLFFDVQPKPGHVDHYFAHVDRLKPILARHRGLLYLERFRPLDDPDALLSHQLWEDETAISAWRCDTTHRVSQCAGRKLHFDDYRIRVGPQEIGSPDDMATSIADGRLVVAAYGNAPVADGRGYESITRPGRYLTLIEMTSAQEASDLANRALTQEADEVRVFRITRDYTMTDRREAPADGGEVTGL